MEKLPAPHRGQQRSDAQHADHGETFSALAHPAHPEPHQHGDRHRAGDGEEAPRTFRERLDDDEGEHGEQDHHNGGDAHEGDAAGKRTDLVAYHLAEGFSAAARGAKQNHRIVHRAAHGGTDEHPQHPGQITKLRRQHGADQRSGAGDGGEMVTEDDPLVRFHEVTSVGVDRGGRGAKFVEREDLGHEPRRVEPVADGKNTQRGDDHPEGVDGFAARPREHADRPGPQ